MIKNWEVFEMFLHLIGHLPHCYLRNNEFSSKILESDSAGIRLKILRKVLWNAPKSMWKIYFSRDGICIFLKCHKIEEFHIRFLFCLKIDHVLICLHTLCNRYAITWKIYLSHAFWGISYYLPYKNNRFRNAEINFSTLYQISLLLSVINCKE